MIFLKLKIDNFYMFKDTEIDFTYPKKIKNSTIKGEYLEEFPNIKYKKVCIFMGANASGKTSLGKVMCSINNYLMGGPLENIAKVICDKDKEASVEVVYVTPKTKQIHKLIVKFNQEGLIFEQYRVCKLKKTYSLEQTFLDVDESSSKFLYDKDNNHGIEKPGFKSVAYAMGYHLHEEEHNWSYMFSAFNNSTVLDANINTEIRLLKKILSAFDSSIVDVKKIPKGINPGKNSYVVHFANKDSVIIDDGKMLNPERFSRGTLESIEVASFISFLQLEENGTFFLDEKMAYSHSEMEMAILNLLIEKLKSNSQLFYTTHNYDVLEMNLPSHSYTFMRKEDFVEVIHPEKLGYTKNDRSLLGFVKNDVFGTLPDTTKIEELLW
ncbi:hypothetical protein SPBRAN_1110 [uncultured Candidatus Thioglobus sp.]|nr:hypothetical protein SPBRAN_1110 [uncultured Candidatus Thioglobus sp.]